MQIAGCWLTVTCTCNLTWDTTAATVIHCFGNRAHRELGNGAFGFKSSPGISGIHSPLNVIHVLFSWDSTHDKFICKSCQVLITFVAESRWFWCLIVWPHAEAIVTFGICSAGHASLESAPSLFDVLRALVSPDRSRNMNRFSSNLPNVWLYVEFKFPVKLYYSFRSTW